MNKYDFKFNGTAKEYFGIWIFNIFMSVITIGIYSAWAKVRNKKYFYGNTELDNHNFDYRATGKQIFIGRLIAFVAYIAFVALSALNPVISIILALAFIFILPWALIASLRFNARVSSYRNVGFNFQGKYSKALWLWMVLPMLVYTAIILVAVGGAIGVSELGLGVIGGVLVGLIAALLALFGFAYVQRELTQFFVRNHLYADQAFETKLPIRPYIIAYIGFLIFLAIAAAIFGAIAGGFGVLGMFEDMQYGIEPDTTALFSFLLLVYVFLFVAVVPASAFLAAIFRNIMWNNTGFNGGKIRFHSTVSPLRYFWIIVSNLVVTIVSLGLMRPWAAVREARYLATCSAMSSDEPLDKFVGDIKAGGNAGAAEYMDFEGLDLGVGV